MNYAADAAETIIGKMRSIPGGRCIRLIQKM